MISINNISQELPYQLLKIKYDEALKAGQKGIEAISISSYNKEVSEVDSRYVNLKFISNDQFIFFIRLEGFINCYFEIYHFIITF